MGTGFAKRKKQAKAMQEQFAAMQEQLKNIEITGKAGGDMVAITVNGDCDVLKVRIKPEAVDKEDVEGLEDLIKLAFNDASRQVQEKSKEGLPGMGGLGGMAGLGF